MVEAGDLVPLLMEREKHLMVMPASQQWQIGDRIIYLLHDPRPTLLKRLSGGTQSNRLSLDKLPEVEEFPLAKLSQLSASDTSTA